MEKDQGQKSISPEQVLLSAFEYFETDRLDLDSLMGVAMMANCPNPETAQRVLKKLVNAGILNWEKDENETVWFTIPETPENEIQ